MLSVQASPIKPLSLFSGDTVTARSKGAVVSVSSYGTNGNYSWPASEGILNGPSCWSADSYESGWYQYTFNTTVTLLEVQTQGCYLGGYVLTFKLSCLNNRDVWTDVQNDVTGDKIFTATKYGGNTIIQNTIYSRPECKAVRIISYKKNGSISMRSELIILDY